MIKKCLCGEIKRGAEFKRHLNKYKDAPNEHKELAVISGCIHCLKFTKGKQNEEFYTTHLACPTTKVANYTTSDVGKMIVRYFNETSDDVETDLDKVIQSIIGSDHSAAGNDKNVDTESQEGVATNKAVEKPILNDVETDLDKAIQSIIGSDHSAAGNDENDDSESEEVVVTNKAIKKPILHSSPKTTKGIKKQTEQWCKDSEIAKVSQEFAVRKIKDELTRYKNECAALRDENFSLKAQVSEIRSLKTQVKNLEPYQQRAITSEKRVDEQVKLIKSLRTKEETLQLQLEQTKLSLVEARNVTMKEKRTTLHLPITSSRIVDDILIQKEELDCSFECYEGAMPDIRCLHVSITHDGEIKELRHRKRKLPAKYLPQPSPSKGSRTG